MELKEAIEGRRSCRKFKDIPVSDEDIKAIVESGINAPSATNTQPWYFIAVSDPVVIEELRTVARGGAEVFEGFLKKRFPDHPDVVRSTTQFIGSLGNSPFVVLAFIRNPETGTDDSPVVQSIAAAIENMVLTAYDKGIGSCWMTSLCGGEAAQAIHARFAPERGPLAAIITFGYSDEMPKMPRRKDDRVEYI